MKKKKHNLTETKVYLRKTEIKTIQNFIKSKGLVLNVTGPPGVGKTHVIRRVLKTHSHIYLNHYIDDKILPEVRKTKVKIVCIDEFDKYEAECANDAKKLILFLQKKKIKLITISNYLCRNENVLNFKPYSTDEIEEIIMQKIKDEYKTYKIDKKDIKLIAKKCAYGDLRQVHVEINRLNNYDNEIIQSNFHKETIKQIKNRIVNRNDVYAEYIKRCKEAEIQFLDRNDFSSIFDIV